MNYILFFIAIVVILARGNWYVRGKRIKNNLLRYSAFSILSSVILAFLQMNINETIDGDIIKELNQTDNWVLQQALQLAEESELKQKYLKLLGV